MTRGETKIIIRSIMAAYPNYHPDNVSETIDVWAVMLEDEEYKVISTALKTYIRTNRSGFAPSIGQLIDIVHSITKPKDISAAEAWTAVFKAICNGAYNSVAEFEKLPELAQKAVGTPKQIETWATDEHFNQEVARAVFIKAYNAEEKRQNEFERMPGDVRRLIERGMNMIGTAEEDKKELCAMYSARDENDRVHCSECPLVIDPTAFVCKRVVAEDDARDLRQEYPDWLKYNAGKCHGCFGAANNDCVECGQKGLRDGKREN